LFGAYLDRIQYFSLPRQIEIEYGCIVTGANFASISLALLTESSTETPLFS
jgi:hypothetical protein